MWDWQKNMVVDSIESVPEKYRGLYAEVSEGDNAGKFAVVDGAKQLVSDYIGTSKALTDERAKVTNLNEESAGRRKSLQAFDDVFTDLGIEDSEDARTPENLKAKIDEMRQATKAGKDLQTSIENVRTEMQKKLDAEIAKRDEALAKKDSSLTRFLIDGEASRAISEAKGSTKALLPHVKQHCKVVHNPETDDYVVRVYDEQGNVRYNEAGEPASVRDLVAGFKKDEDFAALFESEAPSGGGMRPGSGGAPNAQTPSGGEKTSLGKISSGLKAGQYQRGGQAA